VSIRECPKLACRGQKKAGADRCPRSDSPRHVPEERKSAGLREGITTRSIVHHAEQAGDTHFLVMEYVEGTDLDRLAGERGPPPVAEMYAYARQAALGLQHAF
jgi:hypothetical protein